MLGKLELRTQASHEVVEEWLAVINDDVPSYAILIDNVHPDEVNDIFLFYFPQWNCFCPFEEVISSREDVGAVSYTHLTLPTKRIV